MGKQTQTLIETYAKSLVAVATEKDSLSELMSDIKALLTIFQETGLEETLSSIAVNRQDKLSLVRTLQVSSLPYLTNFLEVILQNQREALLWPILKAVQVELTTQSQQHDVWVTTVQPLTDTQKQRMSDLVAKRFAIEVGQVIEIIDASIIGGFIIRANNKVLDMSIRQQLQAFKWNLK